MGKSCGGFNSKLHKAILGTQWGKSKKWLHFRFPHKHGRSRKS